MTISLSPETQRLIEHWMQDGRFTSADDLLQTALQLMQHTRGRDVEELDIDTQAAIEEGEAEADRGEGVPVDDAFAQIRRKHFGT